MKNHYPSIFISYSHDSEEHRDRSYALKIQLKRDGCKCIIDRDQLSLKPRWPRWCEDQIEALDFVIVVCSKIYGERYKAKTAAGKGVIYQGYVITEDFYKKHSSDKTFIPVCFEKEDTAYIPTFLKGANYYVISQVDEYIKLLRELFNTPEYFEVELGPRPDLGQTPPPVLFEASTVKEIVSSSDIQQSEPSIIELTLDRDLEECSPEDQKKLTMAIMTILSIADVNIVRKQNGSGKLAIELPTDKAELLSKAVQAGLLNEHKVINAEISYDTKEWYYQALDSFGAELYREKVSVLPNLSQLYIGHRRFINLVGFPVLPKLSKLILYYDQIISLEGFPDLPNLSELDLSRNQLSSLAGLPVLPNLNSLDLSSNQLSSLEDFPDLPNLNWLDLRGNSLKEEDIFFLQRKLPQCEIFYDSGSSEVQ